MIWKLTKLPKPVTCLFTVLTVAGVVQSQGRASTTLSVAHLEALMRPIEPWPGWGTNYSRSNWVLLVAAAKVIQGSSAATVGKALERYQMGNSTNRDLQPLSKELDNDTKLYLLMRVVFDLPEALQLPKKRLPFAFGCWAGLFLKQDGETNTDGTFNLAWPIRWNRGHPALLAGWIGYEGPRYHAAGEYHYFRQKYRFRDLSSFSGTE
jgi:hypothetical protein